MEARVREDGLAWEGEVWHVHWEGAWLWGQGAEEVEDHWGQVGGYCWGYHWVEWLVCGEYQSEDRITQWF